MSFCPCCHKSSKSIHSRYERTLSDLPVSGKEVKVILESRRFFCKNKKCKRKIFTERFSTQISSYRRRFDRSLNLIRKLGLELGGNKGSTICKAIGNPVSSSSVLRTVKQIPLSPILKTSGVIGVDDWAFKKGRNYGTIIVDLKSKKVIDLLPDREAGTLAKWLANHPEVHTVSRDRASAYSLGIRTGSPSAIQVADRFHLLVNLRVAFQNSLYKHGTILKECFRSFSTQEGESEGDEDHHGSIPLNHINDSDITKAPIPDDAGLFVGTVNPKRQHKFQKAKDLHQKGYSVKAIAKQLGSNRETIRKYIDSDCLSSREARSRTNFNNFESEVLRRSQIKESFLDTFNYIVKLGFNGKYSSFCERMNKLINDGKNARTRVESNLPRLSPIKTWSVTKLSFMALSKSENLKEEDKSFINLLYLKSPEIQKTAILANSFKELFVTKKEGSLREWVENATTSESGLKRFAKGINSDYEAVNQAVVSAVNNGQVEGQVNRLKTIKRKMYGRAGYPLLKQMVLATPE
jgi:transposase